MKLDILKQYFGHDEFREGQESLIDSILSGRDCLGIMPTGAGKSVCYQLPSLMMEGIVFVISPLISLMKDQVGALKENGIAAAYINSSLTAAQVDIVLQNARDGKYKLIYIAPERLDSDNFLMFAQSANISMVTVDEAHCVSQWGQDFRPSYRKVAAFIEKLNRRPIVSAFTATATDEVRQDIMKLLRLENPFEIVTGFNRENLYFEVQEPQDKYEAVIEYLSANKDKSGIIYASTRDNVEQVCARLSKDGYGSTRYHAGLSESERAKNQDDFLYDAKTIMVATNAFGMGIDKSNVSFVIHYNMPKNIESYYQEAGRAGRDGAPADCIMLYGGRDVITNQYFIENTNEKNDLPPEMIELIKRKDRERLKQMTYYCHTNDCLREYILKYFKDKAQSFCGNCSNCLNSFEQIEITEYAQKILSCISRMNERFGIKMLIDTLRGSKSERIMNFGLNELKTYGIMSEVSEKRTRDIINYLVLNEYIMLTDSEFATTRLTEKSRDVLFGGEKLYMKIAKDYEKKEKQKTSSKSKAFSKAKKHGQNVNSELFAKLKEVRTVIATAKKVPAYLIFADSALIDMCAKMPTSESAFLKVSGVGSVKLERYGKEFLAAIKEFKSSVVR